MFTGLIEDVGFVTKIERKEAAAKLTIATRLPLDRIAIGGSIAISGICLTVTGKGAGTLSFDVSPETIDRTTLKELQIGSPVNLERALAVSGRLDGHIVSGHVDCVAVVAERRSVSGSILFSFRLPKTYLKYIVPKGSVTIDGISLTVNAVSAESFSVNIIPHTTSKTCLKDKEVGSKVNIETDILAKYLEKLFISRGEVSGGGLSLDLLAKNGFV